MAEVRTKGLRELGELLVRAPNRLQWEVLKDATAGMAQVIVVEAEARAPFRTGRLSHNIVKQRQRPTKDRELFKVAVRRKIYYWKFQEFGTSRHPAHPFMRPAAASKADVAVNVFAQIFRAGVFRVMGVV